MENLYRFYTDNHESELIKDNQFKKTNSGFFYEAKNFVKLQGNRTINQLEKLLESKSNQNMDFWEIETDLA